MFDERIKSVIASVMGADVSAIDDNASPHTIPAWDSLKQMNLIIALEEEFSISFTDEQVSELLNYKLIKLTIEELLSANK